METAENHCVLSANVAFLFVNLNNKLSSLTGEFSGGETLKRPSFS